MANTVIQLKYSNVTGTPPSLNLAEPAYSNVSNKLCIDDGTGVVAIGGKYYTQLIDAATAEGIANTIVRRSADGHFNGNRVFANTINANTAVIQNGYNLYDFANAAFTQANTALEQGGVIAGGYANSAFAQANTALQYATSAGSYANSAYSEANNATFLAEDALQHAGSAGSYANSAHTQANTATTDAATADQKAVSAGSYANSAYAHANTRYSSSGGTISGDVAITGNLIVQGNTTTYEVDTYTVNDPIVLFANNNLSNVVDIGFAAHYVENSTTKHTGLVKDVSENKYFLFDNYEPHIQEEHTLNIANPTLAVANLVANLITDSALIRGYDPINHANAAYFAANTADQRAVTSGDYANSAYLQANTATQYATSAGSYANSAYGQANTGTSLAQAAFDVANNAVGGTATDGFARNTANAASSYANSAYTQANTATTLAQAAFDVANTDLTFISAASGSYGSATAVPTFNLEANGRISSITTTTIALDASAITSGTLGVARGGTGNTAFTSNHVIIGNGTGALTTTGSSTEGHLLTINSLGVPTFQHLNGGTF
jgi:hypothetical protein